MKGYVRIEHGPLRFTVQADEALTVEQMRALEPIAREMALLASLFAEPSLPDSPTVTP